MPFLVNVEIKESPIAGRGVFSAQAITAGTKVWEFVLPPGVQAASVKGYEVQENRTWTREELEQQAQTDPKAMPAILWGGYYHEPSGTFLELRDGNQFTNHCVDAPLDGQCLPRQNEENDNIVRDDSVALRDIATGEELTENYSYYAGQVTPKWLEDLMDTFAPRRMAFERTLPPMPNRR